ncbi:hypothetical protein [Actinoallomurus sp. NPDC052274]|uniref:hypothetical protein n=1 Tax=Actinoallomurus sp. NPDC052274 TaxID=3155420 RepID=UPI003448934B
MGSPSKQHFSVNDESSPEGHWNGKYDDFKALGEALDIPTFQKSAAPYEAAQGLLLQTYEELTTQAYRLADKWQGKAAAEFQNNLRALYVSACSLADATGQVNVAIGYHASDLETLKENVEQDKPDTGTTFNDVFFGDSWDGLGIFHRTTDKEAHQNAADSKVRDWINGKLTTNTTTFTFGELPKQVQLEIPNPTPGISKPDDKAIPPGGHVPNMGGPNAHGGTPNLKSPSPHLNSPNPHLNSPNPHLNSPTPHQSTPNTNPDLNPPGSHTGTGGADLSGLSPHDGSGLGKGLGPGGGLKGLDSHGLGGGGGGLGGLGSHGLGGGGLGGGGLGGGGLGGGGLGGLGRNGVGADPEGALGAGRTGGLASGAAAQEEAAAARAAAAGRGGVNGMPMGMGGGGAGGQEQERERTTWLTEDEDIWGGDGDVAPPVIG